LNDKIFKILSEILEEPIDINTTRNNSNNWDSINQIKIILMLQTEFSVSFSAQEISDIHSVKDITNIISQKIKM
jgi:acyl carrier protein